MRKTATMSTNHYKWVEKNIAKIGPSTYRIRVGSFDGYAPTRESARKVKRTFLSKLG